MKTQSTPRHRTLAVLLASIIAIVSVVQAHVAVAQENRSIPEAENILSTKNIPNINLNDQKLRTQSGLDIANILSSNLEIHRLQPSDYTSQTRQAIYYVYSVYPQSDRSYIFRENAKLWPYSPAESIAKKIASSLSDSDQYLIDQSLAGAQVASFHQWLASPSVKPKKRPVRPSHKPTVPPPAVQADGDQSEAESGSSHQEVVVPIAVVSAVLAGAAGWAWIERHQLAQLLPIEIRKQLPSWLGITPPPAAPASPAQTQPKERVIYKDRVVIKPVYRDRIIIERKFVAAPPAPQPAQRPVQGGITTD